MNAESLMIAIGNINNKYIMEFSNVERKKYFSSTHKWLPFVAACMVLVVCITSIINYRNTKPIIDNPNHNITSSPGGESVAPIHFYLNGQSFVADPNMKLVTEVPEGYHYVGTVTDVGNTFSGKDFEGNASGAVYLSEDGKTAYFEATVLEKINGKNALVLCIIYH